jgi:putative peptidoglycan lipid II flippase
MPISRQYRCSPDMPTDCILARMTPIDTPPSPEPPPPSQALTGSQIAQAAGVVMLGFILSRLLGVALDILIADIWRNSATYDAFVAASRPPETIYLVVAGGALGSAFIPTFIGYFVRGEPARAWRMASSVVNAFMLIMAALSGLAALFALPLVRLFLPGFPPDEAALTAHLMQIMLLTPLIFTVSGLLMGILNARQHFLLPALAPSLYNVGIILGAVFLAPTMGIDGLAWGTVVGAGLHLLVQLPGLMALRPRYRPIIDFKDAGFWEVVRLMGPRVLGLTIVQINFWVELILASGMTAGSISALRRGFMLMLMPEAVIAQSVAIAVFPTFAAQVAGGQRADLRRTLGQSLRTVLFLSLPATVGLILLRLPIVQALYQRGAFTADDSQAVAWALLYYGLGLVFHSLLEIVTRAFYAMHDTRTPVIVGGGAMLLNIAFSLLLREVIGVPGSLVRGPFGGLALANTLATGLEVTALLILLRPRVAVPPTDTTGLNPLGKPLVLPLASLGSIGRMVIASAVMGVGLWLALPLLPADGLGLALGTAGAVALGGAAYWGIAWGLGSDEARLLSGALVARLRRGGQGSAISGQ